MIYILFFLTAWVNASPRANCGLYLEKLGRIDEIRGHLARHRERVLEHTVGELIPITSAHRDCRLEETLLRRNDPAFFDWMEKHGNGATLFHGAGSASLMAFMPEGSLGLLPGHVLRLDLDIVPLTGWCDSVGENPRELNNIGLNVVRAAQFRDTDQYADGFGRWTREGARQMLENGYLPDEYTKNIYRTRLELLDDVPVSLRWIVERSFPVVYGFDLRDDTLLWLPCNPRGPHTIVASNLSPQELRVVFVPAEKVDEVRAMLRRLRTEQEIRVIALEDTREARRKTFSNFDYSWSEYKEIYGSDEEFEKLIARLRRKPPRALPRE